MTRRNWRAPRAAVLAVICAAMVVGDGLATRAAAAGIVERIDPAATGRQYVDLDFDWLFHLGDLPAGFHPQLDDAAWQAVQLPHDWSIAGPFGPAHASGTGYAPGGIAWYHKRFTLGPGLAGRRVAVEFDGVYQNAQVWINGQLVGGRPYGYSSFECDLTPHLDLEGENVLAVRVDHAKVADSRWYTGSGIYRHVRLRVTNAVAVAKWGTYVTTPEVSDERATVAVEAEVDNRDQRRREATLRLSVLDAEGRAVGVTSVDAAVDAGTTTKVAATMDVDGPKLWGVDSPNLYTLRTEVLDENDAVVDATDTPFGIRTFRFDPDRGFFLNGQNLKLHGVCLHHDAGCLGAAVPAKVLERRLLLMRELGANAVRTSHNPPAPELLDMCDRLGLLVQDEAFDEFTPPKNKWVEGRNVGLPARFGHGEIFDEWAVRDVQDMVRRDRNHPSIIMWSIGNEIDYPNDPFSHPVLGNEYRPTHPRAELLVGHGRRLVAAVKEVDATRPVTAALARIEMTNAVGFPELLDVVGYNYQEGEYADDHAKYPERVIYGSENDDNYGAWRAVADHDYISGQFLWTGFDYLGEAGEWPARVFAGGVADLAGFRKPLAWWRQALWTREPMVYVAASQRAGRGGGRGRGFGRRGGEPLEHWNWSDAAPVRVMVATNCPTVDVLLNGAVVATLERGDDRQGWRSAEIDFEPGTLTAVGRDGDERLCEFVIRTAGPAAAVRVAADATELAADGHDAVHVTFEIVDENGVRVPDAEQEVTFDVAGPVRILGIDNGRTAGAVDYQDERCEAYRGRGLAILQSQRGVTGTATIRATAEGLTPAEITLEVN